jgi:hypothetical protein
MTSNRNTIIRSMHDLGGATWFGGSLMGAIGVNGASKDVKDPTERATVASAGWARWADPAEGEVLPPAGAAPVEGGTVPSEGTPDKMAKLQEQQRVLQWVTPALTGGILILGAQ